MGGFLLVVPWCQQEESTPARKLAKGGMNRILYPFMAFKPKYIKEKKKIVSILCSIFGFRYLVGGQGSFTYQ